MKLKKTSSRDDMFQSFDIIHNEEIIGRIKQHTTYVDNKPKNRCYVTKRKEIKKWSLQLSGEPIKWGLSKRVCLEKIEHFIFLEKIKKQEDK